MTASEMFIRDFRRSYPRLAGHAVNLAQALEAMDFEGDEIPDAKARFSAIEWIMGQPDSIERRIRAIARLFELTGKVNLNMREFYGLQ